MLAAATLSVLTGALVSVSFQMSSSGEGLEFCSNPSFWPSACPHPHAAESSNTTTVHEQHRHRTCNKLHISQCGESSPKQAEHKAGAQKRLWVHLGHELEAALDAGRGFLVQDARLVRGHDGGVDEAQEHGAAHGPDAVLGEALAHHLGKDSYTQQGWFSKGRGLTKALPGKAKPKHPLHTAHAHWSGTLLHGREVGPAGQEWGSQTAAASPSAAAQLPWQGHGSQSSCHVSELTHAGPCPCRDPQDSGVPCPPQHRTPSTCWGWDLCLSPHSRATSLSSNDTAVQQPFPICQEELFAEIPFRSITCPQQDRRSQSWGAAAPLPTHTLQNQWADVKYPPLPSRKKEFWRCCKKKEISFPLGNQLCITTRRDVLWISFI